MWQRQKVSLILSVKHGQRSASEKKNEPYFLMAARKVCSIRSMGCCSQRPWRMFDLSSLAVLEWREALLLGGFALFAEYTATPCMERTGEMVENKEHPTIGDTALQVKLNGSPDGCDQWRSSPPKKQELWTLAIYIGVILPLQFQSQSLNMRKSILPKPFI